MKTIIAIDGGASGGIAWKHPNTPPGCIAMPKTPKEVCAVLRTLFWTAQTKGDGFPVVYLENIVKHMGAGIPASTMAVYASNWGVVQGAALYAGATVELITPQEWQKALGLGITGRQKAMINSCMSADQAAVEKKRVRILNAHLKMDWKNKLKSKAMEFFPSLAHEITLKTSDACLILQYGFLKMNHQ